LTDLPSESPDPIANITLVELEFHGKDPKNDNLGNYPQFKGNSLW
jgi:hypothetical protein